MGAPHHQGLSAVFRALGDDTRLALFALLNDRDEQTLFEIAARLYEAHGLNLAPPVMSEHLDALQEAGLISAGLRGPSKVFTVNRAPLRDALAPWLHTVLSGDRP